MSDILFRLPAIYEASKILYNEIIGQNQSTEFEISEKKGSGENQIAFGDNLKYMKYLIDRGYAGKIDLIYIDPPFFSKADYTINIKVGTGNRKIVLTKNHAFTDKWDDGLSEYLTQITVSLMMMRELLADTGSIFMHLDWHSTHYVKIIMDEIFGEKNFINEIIWTYKSGGVSNRYFARKHDTILFYSKTKDYFFEVQKEKSYNREFKPYRFKGVKEYKDEIGWYTLVNMKDVWQIDMVGRTSAERTGYATQKPEAVIERILNSVTRKGSLCADFFCGSGTLGAVCEKLGRKYLICDNGAPAAVTAHKRLTELGSDHVFLSEKREISDNFTAEIGLDTIEGVVERLGISIKGISYADLKKLGIDEKNASLMQSIMENHYEQLIEYWCMDTDFDGQTLKPDIYCCRKKDELDLSVILPKDSVRRLGIRVVDSFGNIFQTEF